MKKHKSVVAILLAVMMIFTMMPMMAFATDTNGTHNGAAYTATWNDDYSKVTINGASYNTVKTWMGDSSGMIKATVDKSQYSTSAAAAIPDAEVYYYDLAGSKLLVNGQTATQYNRDEFNTVFGPTAAHKIQIARPAGLEQASGTKTTAGTVTVNALTGWTVKVEKPADFKADATEDQKFTVAAEVTTENTINGTADYPYLKGNVGAAELTFLGKAKTAENAQFFFDEVAEKKAIDKGLVYDGAEHKVVMQEIAGYTVSYSVFNKSTGAYDSVAAVTLKDVTDPVKVKAVVTNGKDRAAANYKEYYFQVVVTAADTPYFNFDEDGNEGSYHYSVDGETYNLDDYVVVDTATATQKATVKAAKADLIAFVKEYYEIKTAAKKVSPNTLKLTAEPKTLTETEKKALDTKYATLIANFGFTKSTAPTFVGGNGNVRLEINFKAPGEIEFVNTPTSKTYKAKVLKKKAKSFTAKAVCDTGHAVSYKLMNAPQKIVINKTTGKITLKKGLKKGTYKVKVKAYINNDYFETHAITIKVKK